jgi:uncharacterized membrane protein YhhN
MASPRLSLLAAFAPYLLASLVDLAARLLGLDALATLTKPVLMPSLALAVALSIPASTGRNRTLLLGAVGLSWAGDLLLMNDGLPFFAAGLGAFLLAHVLYVMLFRRAFEEPVSRFAFAYAAAYLMLIYVLAPHVDVLLIPVLVYGAVLCTMAALATRGGALVTAGGAAFVASDAMLALTRFVPGATIPHASFLIMLTYLGAQGLIALGVARRARCSRDLSAE